MAGLIFILPILAFDIWLFCTTGPRQIRRWIELKQTKHMVIAALVGIGLSVWITFFVQYGHEQEIRKGFPIPLLFFHPDSKVWARNALPTPIFYLSMTVDILTGLVAPLIPYKIAEFLKQVKAELK